MKKNILSAVALALCLSFAAGNLAYAQEEGDFSFPPQEAAAAPAPMNPAVKTLDSGRLIIAVGSTRNFGYHIGELVPVTIVISADKNVMINIEALKRKTLAVEGSDFELAETPLVTSEEKDGKLIYRVQLLLRSWVVKPQLILNCDFHYATEFLPDGKTPNWKPVTSPDFVLETSNLASEAAKELLPGELELKESPKPALAQLLKYASYALMSLLPIWLLLKLWNRVRPARPLSSAELVWVEFDRIMSEAETEGKLSYEHLRQLAGTLRAYLRIESVPTSEVAIPLEQFFALHENKMELMTITVSALAKLERALFSKLALTESELATLMNELERIVPRS